MVSSVCWGSNAQHSCIPVKVKYRVAPCWCSYLSFDASISQAAPRESVGWHAGRRQPTDGETFPSPEERWSCCLSRWHIIATETRTESYPAVDVSSWECSMLFCDLQLFTFIYLSKRCTSEDQRTGLTSIPEAIFWVNGFAVGAWHWCGDSAGRGVQTKHFPGQSPQPAELQKAPEGGTRYHQDRGVSKVWGGGDELAH